MTTGFDPEAEQEVDFGRYRRLLAARWWVPAGGLVLGAVIGYLVALGGSQVFKATATLYLGQPYSASGTQQLQGPQTNPSSVRQIAHADSVIALESNAIFVDSYLAGLNSQLLGELRWRNIPVATGCTPIRRFWDRTDTGSGERADDIVGIGSWAAASHTSDHARGTTRYAS